MYKVIEVPSQEDISQFSRLLWQRKISHRILSLENTQVLIVPDRQHVHEAAQLFQQWRRGDIHPSAEDSANVTAYFKPGETLRQLAGAFTRAPVTLLLIIICVVLTFLAPLENMNSLTLAMLYPDFSYGTRLINLSRVLEGFSVIQFLKMMSPILLHGGLIHLSFNMLWLWEFGRRIEAVQPSWVIIPLVMVIALVSNTAQYLYAGSIYFGGMSGVVYGLFGYIWMWQLFYPQKRLKLPGALIFFMLLALVVMTAINLDFVADEAHIGGILTGVVYGAVTATFGRMRYKSSGQPGSHHG